VPQHGLLFALTHTSRSGDPLLAFDSETLALRFGFGSGLLGDGNDFGDNGFAYYRDQLVVFADDKRTLLFFSMGGAHVRSFLPAVPAFEHGGCLAALCSLNDRLYLLPKFWKERVRHGLGAKHIRPGRLYVLEGDDVVQSVRLEKLWKCWPYGSVETWIWFLFPFGSHILLGCVPSHVRQNPQGRMVLLDGCAA
jgi:hypothetical protein